MLNDTQFCPFGRAGGYFSSRLHNFVNGTFPEGDCGVALLGWDVVEFEIVDIGER